MRGQFSNKEGKDYAPSKKLRYRENEKSEGGPQKKNAKNFYCILSPLLSIFSALEETDSLETVFTICMLSFVRG